MATATITADLGFDRLVLKCDLAQASSPIRYLGGDDDDEWVTTPYQVADARHDEHEAVALVVAWLGGEYYEDPSSDDSPADQLASLLERATVKVAR